MPDNSLIAEQQKLYIGATRPEAAVAREQATARTYEETLEEAVDVAEKKLLAGRQPDSGDKDDTDGEELQRRELQAWDEKFEKDSEKERDDR